MHRTLACKAIADYFPVCAVDISHAGEIRESDRPADPSRDRCLPLLLARHWHGGSSDAYTSLIEATRSMSGSHRSLWSRAHSIE